MKIERILRKERSQIQALLTKFNERLTLLDEAAAILNGNGNRRVRHRHMSAATRAKISKAQRTRFAKLRRE